MSNVDAPDVGSGETNIPDLLAEQSGMPNMSSTRTFVVDTNMQVNGDLDVTGTVTATSFIGDGSQLTGISGGTGGGLDSAAVTLLVDSDYVQARETPQDFAYSSLTGAPTALSSFTNDTSYITAADIPTTVDSAYVQARVTLDGVGLDSAGVTALVDSDYVALRAPAGGGLEGFDVSQYDSATSNGIFEYNVSGGGQKQLLFSLNTAVAPIPRSDATLDNQVNYTLSTNHQFGFKDAGGFRTEVYGRAAGTTASTGLVLTGPTFNNSGVELVGNLKLSSLPTSDPSEAGLLWNDGGIPVFSGSTAPTGGGLDSAGVTALINEPYLRDTLYDVAAAQTNIGLDAGFASTSNFSIAIGKESGINSGNATNSIAIGFKAGQNISDNSIMIGRQTAEFSPVSFSVGIGTEALQNTAGNGAVAVGYRAGQNNSGLNSVAVGINAVATANYAVSIGDNATVSNPAVIGIAIGRNTSVTTPGGTGGVAIGSGASVSDNDTLAIGRNTVASAADATAIGPNTTASGLRSIAIGNNVTAITDDAVTIGSSVAGRVTYDTTNDWTFGAGVTMTDLTSSGVVIFSALPTTDPVNAGQLWNDAGTLKVSAG